MHVQANPNQIRLEAHTHNLAIYYYLDFKHIYLFISIIH